MPGYSWLPIVSDVPTKEYILANGLPIYRSTTNNTTYYAVADGVVKVAAVYSISLKADYYFSNVNTSTIYVANGSVISAVIRIEYGNGLYYIANGRSNVEFLLDSSAIYTNQASLVQAVNDGVWTIPVETYPITYHYTNSTVSGPSEAAVGDTVVVSAVPDNNYGITDPTMQIAVTSNDDPVNFTWDASTNRITFTMPDPT